MNLGYIVKINFLVLALVLVFFAMNKLRQQGLNGTMADVLGVSSQATTTLDWCDTRVVSLERPNRPTLKQVKLKWLWQSQPELELNFVAVEKWFGRNCRLKIERVPPQQFDSAAAQPVLIVNFLKGPAETLFAIAGGIYRWRQEIFRSVELGQALADLEALPEQGARTTVDKK